MPLIADFFRTALDHIPQQQINTLLQFTRDNFGVRGDDILAGRIDIEELLTLLDCDSAWRGSDRDDQRQRQQPTVVSGLLTLITRDNRVETMTTTLLTRQHSPIASGAPLHRRLARILDDGDTVITFNYDLIADWALFTEHRCTPANYHMPFEFETETFGATRTTIELQRNSLHNAGPIDLLKLHGSLNWLQRKWQIIDSQRLSRDAIVYLKTSPSGMLDETLIWPLLNFQESNGSNVPLVPAIIVPTVFKTTAWHGFSGSVRELWLHAHSAIRRSTHLALIGYSLRPADYLSNWLLRSATAENCAERETYIVNPCPADRSRIASALSQSSSQIYELQTFEEYLDRLTG
jgi:hypothetical protein